MTKISDAAHLRRLASEVLLQAVRDLNDPKKVLDSAAFLVGDGFKIWAAVLDMDAKDPTVVFRQMSADSARELVRQIYDLPDSGNDNYSWKQVLQFARSR